MASTRKKDEHLFSIELKSKEYVKSIALPHDKEGHILIEGFLGKLKNLGFTEGVMLEIEGVNGSLKMDLCEDELQKLYLKGRSSIKRAN